MGWRGTVRTLGAIARQSERESMKRARDHARHMVAMEKLEAKEQAAAAVLEYEKYVHKLVTIHRSCSTATDWEARAKARPPSEPWRKTSNEDQAKQKLAAYKPSWLTRILGKTQSEKDALAMVIATAKLADERELAEKLDQYQKDLVDHADAVAFAGRILNRDEDALLEAVKLFEPLASIGLLGEHMSIGLPTPQVMTVELTANGEEVIPKDRAKLLASGRVSVKPMSKGDYYRLYQDHVCSAALRVVREIFALLPVEEVVVTVVDDLVGPSTGHLKKTVILSLRAPRATIDRLNFDAIDPSDSMRNFLHQMEFSPTTGFRATEAIEVGV